MTANSDLQEIVNQRDDLRKRIRVLQQQLDESQEENAKLTVRKEKLLEVFLIESEKLASSRTEVAEFIKLLKKSMSQTDELAEICNDLLTRDANDNSK